jgi:hypothetical protein
MFLLVGEIQEVIWPGHSGDCAGYQMPKLLAQSHGVKGDASSRDETSVVLSSTPQAMSTPHQKS